MDRFIVVNEKSLFDKISDLKSNMDRFIACTFIIYTTFHFYLKSNMDRFIVRLYKHLFMFTTI